MTDGAAARRNTSTRALAADESSAGMTVQAKKPPRRTMHRLTKEVRGGAIGMSIGASIGSTVGLLVAVMGADSDTDSSHEDRILNGASNMLYYSVIGAVVGAYLGIPGGVYAGGSSERDSDGSLWMTYLGGLAGTGASVGALYFIDASNSGAANTLLLGTALVTPFVGAMLGYELSDNGPENYSSISAPLPTLGVAPDGRGGYVGMGFRF